MSITATNASLTTDVIPPFSIDDSTLANDHYLVYNSTTEKFENKALSVGGAVAITGASNLGAGSGVFESASTHTLQFKSIIGGAGITVATDSSSITINNDQVGTSVLEAANNLGAGTGIFGTITGGNTVNLKSLVAGDNISINKKANNKKNKKFSILVGVFYSEISTNELKEILERGYIAQDSLVVKKLGKNKFMLSSKPYTSINTLKNLYFGLNKYGFDDLEIKQHD